MDDAINKDEVCPEEAAFNWLLISGALESLREQCNFYDTETSDCKMERKIFTLVLNVDVGYLLEYDAHLGNIVCNHPQKAKQLFQEACFVCIRTLNWNRHVTSISQINPQIRYTCLPRYIRQESSGLRWHFITLNKYNVHCICF
ncbi:minichromosome maintenance domain-containing protein 2-like [Xenia sp. Carnegie-2017]|uniref:minichromosome maintenance domain-containing protein 2-like n=1 Tax=Xenia sp. Carnegie-2017 TaxID=2897299 RepID=UPI001F034D9A|nr:minichromosome maintenance domain-containing protein 2-like [Xenia sp. Carnegie-2017]